MDQPLSSWYVGSCTDQQHMCTPSPSNPSIVFLQQTVTVVDPQSFVSVIPQRLAVLTLFPCDQGLLSAVAQSEGRRASRKS